MHPEGLKGISHIPLSISRDYQVYHNITADVIINKWYIKVDTYHAHTIYNLSVFNPFYVYNYKACLIELNDLSLNHKCNLHPTSPLFCGQSWSVRVAVDNKKDQYKRNWND